MRSLRPFLFLLVPFLMLGISSCCEDDPFTPTPRPHDSTDVDRSRAAFVRIIHASATAPSVVVMIDGKSLFDGHPLRYLFFEASGNLAKYYPIDTSAKKIDFVDGGVPIASLANLSLQKGKYYTIYLHGRSGAYGVFKTEDQPFPTPGSSSTRLRAINLAPGSPSLSIALAENEPPVVSDLGYAEDIGYTTITRPASRTGLYIIDSTNKKLFGIPPPYVVLQTDAVLTLVMTGSLTPKGDEPFLSFSIFTEAYLDPEDSLYGLPPFRINFGAVRFANLVPLTPDSSLSVSFLDSNIKDYQVNEYFRRNYVGQDPVLTQVYPLGNNGTLGQQKMRKYMLLSTLFSSRYPYRIELGTRFASEGPTPQPVLKEPARGKGFEFRIEPSKRYTIIAYGPKTFDSTGTAVLVDNTRAPASLATATVRFFHGAYDDVNRLRRLKLRIGGIDTPLMAYGELPDGQRAVDVPAGTKTIDLLDENDTVIYTETLDEALKGGDAYTVYLSRGAFGNALVLTQVSEALTLIY